jgi:demethylmenaquinone methyltransferase/2-methoxy-6-polyprenyl-1,4-benzoquinol methylase
LKWVGRIRGVIWSRIRDGSWRYSVGTRAYDALSGEWPVYRVGRVAAVNGLDLWPGARVLDLCCGTGLNFALLQEHIGPTGRLVGVDASPFMVARAEERVVRAGWSNVELMEADVRWLASVVGGNDFDAVIATYALSIVPEPECVWRQALALLRPRGRAAIVDLGLPSGLGIVWWPLARFACWAGGADPLRAPWRMVDRDLTAIAAEVHRAGHVVVRVGERSGDRRG